MRHRVKGKKLSRKIGHRRQMIRNMATSLILYERIITTRAKARIIKAEIDKLLAIAKRGDLHSRRTLLSRLHSKLAVQKIFDDLNHQFKDKKSGFARIVRTNNRSGDNSEMTMVELIIKHKKSERRKDKSKKIKSKKEPEDSGRSREKVGFWDRFRGKKEKQQAVKAPTKKTIERTTSK